jgi:DNA-binding transcriptional MerR regulator
MSSFPVDLTSVLTGASVGQLRYWRRKNRLLVPELYARPALYSFRDLLALRTVVRLRRTHSLRAIRTAFGNLREFDLTEHTPRSTNSSHTGSRSS